MNIGNSDSEIKNTKARINITAILFIIGSFIMIIIGAWNLWGVISSRFVLLIIILTIKIVLCFIVIISSIFLMKLRMWARIVLEIIAWMGLSYFTGYSIFLLFDFFRLVLNVAGSGFGLIKEVLYLFLSVFSFFIADAIWGIPLIFLLRLLRRKEIKGCLKKASLLNKENCK